MVTVPMKKRILWNSEASFLSTGFSTLSHEILTRLHKTDKYDLVETGSYASPNDPRCYNIPWTFYPVIPDPQDKQTIERYNSSVYAQFGADIFESVCLKHKPQINIDVRDMWMCFESADIVMSDGTTKDISHVAVGDYVLSHMQRPCRVAKARSKEYSGEIISIKIGHVGTTLNCTPEHPFLTVAGYISRSSPTKIDPEFVEAKDLDSKKHWLMYPVQQAQSVDVKYTEEELYAMGFFVAEGCYLKYPKSKTKPRRLKGVQICGHVDEYNVVERCLTLFDGLVEDGSINAIQKPKGTNACVGRITSPCLAQFFKDNFGEYAHEKSLPGWVMSLPLSKKAAFVAGLLNGDGCDSEESNSGRYYTVSKSLAQQVLRLLFDLGITGSVSPCHTKIGLKTYNRYIIGINSEEKNYQRYHSLFTTRKIDSCVHANNRVVTWEGKQYCLVGIVSKTATNKNCTIHNIEVEKDHTYQCPVVVHNCGHELWSPFRPYYRQVLMATVDGIPQRQDWIDDYTRIDGILSYNEFGKEVLEQEAPEKVNFLGIVRPGVNVDIFKPIDGKIALKQKMGLPADSFIFLTVMRNQRRKLFPDLIEAFKDYLIKCVESGRSELASKSYLFLHTSNPDAGWDIGKHILDNGLTHKIYMTYMCKKCGAFYPSLYMGELAACKVCNNYSAIAPNTAQGLTREQLSVVYNISDVYIQYSICEGYGMGLPEAKACGLMTLGIDYSGMAPQVREPGGIPIKVGKFFHETVTETEQRRALPDHEDAVRKMFQVATMDEGARKAIGKQAREYVIKHHSYDQAAKVFENAIDSLEVVPDEVGWNNPKPRIKTVPSPKEVPPNLNNAQFVDFCILRLLGKQELLFSYWRDMNVKNLNTGYELQDKRGRQPFDRDVFFRRCMEMVQKQVFWETQRVNLVNPQKTSDMVSWSTV